MNGSTSATPAIDVSGGRAYIGGHWVAAQGTVEVPVTNPATGATLQNVRYASAEQVHEAIAQANDTEFALNAVVFGPTEPAMAVARSLRSGTVCINAGSPFPRADAPWGGPGLSGIGREGGDEGFREFFELKHIQYRLG